MAFGNIILLRQLRPDLSNINSKGILNTEDSIRSLIGIITEIESPGKVSKPSPTPVQGIYKERKTHVIK
jgi:hypothetical protein